MKLCSFVFLRFRPAITLPPLLESKEVGYNGKKTL